MAARTIVAKVTYRPSTSAARSIAEACRLNHSIRAVVVGLATNVMRYRPGRPFRERAALAGTILQCQPGLRRACLGASSVLLTMEACSRSRLGLANARAGNVTAARLGVGPHWPDAWCPAGGKAGLDSNPAIRGLGNSLAGRLTWIWRPPVRDPDSTQGPWNTRSEAIVPVSELGKRSSA